MFSFQRNQNINKRAHCIVVDRESLNEEKTEFFCLGVQNLSKSLSYEFKHSIKILGVHFDYDELSRKKANFEAIIKSI